MRITNGFRVCVFECNVQVAADSPDTYAILERYVFPSLPRLNGTTVKPDISIHLTQGSNQFELLADDAVVASASTAIDLVPELIRILDDAVVGSLKTFRAIHAGAVLLGERALLLPGKTHAGKSSLVAELLRRGAIYFSDEYAVIDSDGHVHAYPRPLLLRNGSAEQSPVLAEECCALTGDAPATIGWIVSLEYVPGGNWSVVPISQSEAVLMLLRNTPHFFSESPKMVALFQRAVAKARCYTGTRAEAADAVSQILRVIGDAA
ncbi:MAG TPA: hypothetical protein VNU92_00370 [Edaphobacter sp.]|jgi:hypothetical protein|nr:hypothetical protein [Edaphobacter sp.]